MRSKIYAVCDLIRLGLIPICFAMFMKGPMKYVSNTHGQLPTLEQLWAGNGLL